MEREFDLGGNTYVILLFVLMFGIIASVIGRNMQGLTHRIKSFFTEKRTYAGDNSEMKYNETGNTLLFTIITIVSLGIIAVSYTLECSGSIMTEASKASGAETWYTILASVSGALAIFFLLKSLIYFTVNSVFFHREKNLSWMSAYHLLTSLSALLTYPLALVTVFTDISHKSVGICLLFTLVLYEILLFYKLNANFRVKKGSFLLFFLYFCTVELIPLMTVWHLCVKINRNLII